MVWGLSWHGNFKLQFHHFWSDFLFYLFTFPSLWTPDLDSDTVKAEAVCTQGLLLYYFAPYKNFSLLLSSTYFRYLQYSLDSNHIFYLYSAPMGSLPGDRIKMSGEWHVESANDELMSNWGADKYSSPNCCLMRSCMLRIWIKYNSSCFQFQFILKMLPLCDF